MGQIFISYDGPLKWPLPSEVVSRPVSWKQGLTSWGSGKRRGDRIAGAALPRHGARTEALDFGGPASHGASVFLPGLAVCPILLGRKRS